MARPHKATPPAKTVPLQCPPVSQPNPRFIDVTSPTHIFGLAVGSSASQHSLSALRPLSTAQRPRGKSHRANNEFGVSFLTANADNLPLVRLLFYIIYAMSSSRNLHAPPCIFLSVYKRLYTFVNGSKCLLTGYIGSDVLSLFQSIFNYSSKFKYYDNLRKNHKKRLQNRQ